MPGTRNYASGWTRLAGHLNASYGRMGSPVVRYTNQRIGFDEIVALYRAADIMVATSLSDGMNLVAKEYVASRTDDRGTLVLSEFTGAAADLEEALLVNPNDTDQLKEAILRAITMSLPEQRRRMTATRSRLRTYLRQPGLGGLVHGRLGQRTGQAVGHSGHRQPSSSSCHSQAGSSASVITRYLWIGPVTPPGRFMPR